MLFSRRVSFTFCVVDGQTKQPLSNVSVVWSWYQDSPLAIRQFHRDVFTNTDANGKIVFRDLNIEWGDHGFTFNLPGYHPAQVSAHENDYTRLGILTTPPATVIFEMPQIPFTNRVVVPLVRK